MTTLVLVRGLPGSGKNAFAETILSGKAKSRASVVSADDYFETSGGYKFDPLQLPQAHAACQQRTERLLRFDSTVVVANTFSQRWELEFYFQIASRLVVRTHVVDLYDGGLTDEELAARNKHGVPVETIAQMRGLWELNWRTGDPRPPWERA